MIENLENRENGEAIERLREFLLEPAPNRTTEDEESITLKERKDQNEGPKTALYFIRHGAHLETPGTEKEFPLLASGTAEAREIGRKIAANENQTVGFYVGNIRSLLSTALAINPDAENPEEIAQSYIARKKVKLEDSLQYKKVRRAIFREKLDAAVKNKSVLKFLVEESDRVAGYDIEELSTYSTMSQSIAQILSRYALIQSNWSKINEEEPHEQNTLYRIFCGREFVYGCFRAKITEIAAGREERDKFVEWYEKMIEGTDEARKEFGKIELTTNASGEVEIALIDSFGSIEITMTMLNKIMTKKLEAIREAAYIIPVREGGGGKEVAIVQYSDGIGFIGGRIDQAETIEQGLVREIKEELGEDNAFLQTAKPISDIYVFKMEAGVRPGEGEHKEKHHFCVLPIPSNKNIVFREAGASITWIPVSELVGKIRYPELRIFIEKNIIPELNEIGT